MRLYSKQGVQNTPFQQVADVLGITQAALYKYFSGRDQLLRDAIALSASKSVDFFFSDKPMDLNAEEELLFYIRKSLLWAAKEIPFNVAFMSVHYFAAQISIIREIQKEITDSRLKRFKSFLEQGNQENCWQIKNTEELALTIHNYILGEMMAIYNASSDEDFEKNLARVSKESLKLISQK